ncbi:LuxR family transcriptional regulator [Burkholderia sp. 117]|nr:LuxR family transcriptional regulator [Burkholderia pseudomallei]PNX03168.1 LuxR family transcriptional regulator [Burkholderia sp. 136(2017)]PNX14406.1 LuxR family transcriptional regulator [Burkholderia sp. 129]PNX29918.1 LuxR family transcriptional regulator [Burkholderia sp. 117]PNX38723.1 LuxR family transcriptional regulator [Burkholderia sp. 137]
MKRDAKRRIGRPASNRRSCTSAGASARANGARTACGARAGPAVRRRPAIGGAVARRRDAVGAASAVDVFAARRARSIASGAAFAPLPSARRTRSRRPARAAMHEPPASALARGPARAPHPLRQGVRRSCSSK